MKKVFIISDLENKNPFLFTLQTLPTKLCCNCYYIIIGYEKALEYNGEISYFDNKINERVYWVSNLDEADELFFNQLNYKQLQEVVIFENINLEGCYLYENHIEAFLLLRNKYYKINKHIVDKFNIEVNITNFIDFNNIRAKMSHIELIGENYKLKNFEKYIQKYNCPYLMLDFIALINEEVEDKEVLKYYNNILYLENYLNRVNYIEYIDLDLADSLELEYDNLKFNYIHSGFDNKTGRIFQSSNNGNFLIQNLNNTKKQIIVSKQNSTLVEIDFNNFELLILLQVLDLKPDFSVDLHLKTYNEYVGIPIEDHNKKREIGKKINFSFLYGSNARNLYYDIIEILPEFEDKTSYEIFSEKINFLFSGEVVKFVEKLKQQFYEQGYINNYFGRKLKADKEYVLLNYYIQSTAADIFNAKAREILDIIKNNGELIIQRFDSMLFNLKNEAILDGILEKVSLELLKPIGGIQNVFKIKTGNNWALLE